GPSTSSTVTKRLDKWRCPTPKRARVRDRGNRSPAISQARPRRSSRNGVDSAVPGFRVRWSDRYGCPLRRADAVGVLAISTGPVCDDDWLCCWCGGELYAQLYVHIRQSPAALTGGPDVLDRCGDRGGIECRDRLGARQRGGAAFLAGASSRDCGRAAVEFQRQSGLDVQGVERAVGRPFDQQQVQRTSTL